MTNPAHLRILDDWLHSYHAEQLFDENGTLVAELAALPPNGQRRMSANPHTNGGELTQELRLPDFRDYAVKVDKPGTTFDGAGRNGIEPPERGLRCDEPDLAGGNPADR
jgi:xylulose-5-phosphate/fructose-6-phosphate phosphoketolase